MLREKNQFLLVALLLGFIIHGISNDANLKEKSKSRDLLSGISLSESELQTSSVFLTSAHSNSHLTSLASPNYANESPIQIDGNDAFADYAANKSWDGSGNATHPYKITGLNITSDIGNLIEIKNTNVHFIISYSLLNGKNASYDGIYLESVVNGIISDNTIFDNGIAGISLKDSNDTIILNNQIHHNGNSAIGLLAALSSRPLSIQQEGGKGSGIYLDPSNDNTIRNNSIYENVKNGILLNDSEDNTVCNNTIRENGWFGVSLTESSEDNKILFNNFIGNNAGGNSQAWDDGTNNVFKFNYWDDWDQSGSYSIGGSENRKDESPKSTLISSVNCTYEEEDEDSPGWILSVVLSSLLAIALLRGLRRNNDS